MKKLTVKVEITSLDSKVSFESIGEQNERRIKFIDNEGDTNYIVVQENTLEYYKKGNIDMKYKFNLDKVTKGYYAIMGNKFDFDIVTNELTIENDYIYIKYDLYQMSDLVNQTELRVDLEVKEESL